MDKKGRIVGIGGIFFKSKDVAELKNWYADKLGMITNEYGASFKGRKVSEPEASTYLQWSLFKKDSTHFAPSEQEFMVNYRVENIEALVEQLKADGVTICDMIETYDYGKFVHILDPEGNKLELWEPIDSVFDNWHKDIKVNHE